MRIPRPHIALAAQALIFSIIAAPCSVNFRLQLLPHFRREPVSDALAEARIVAVTCPAWEGTEPCPAWEGTEPCPESPHTYWTTAGFRAYANHMETAEFKQAFADLLELADDRPTALMCAEAVPWRCHRQLVADALVAGGRRVVHILAPRRTEDHASNSAARVLPGGRLIYDGGSGQQAELFD